MAVVQSRWVARAGLSAAVLVFAVCLTIVIAGSLGVGRRESAAPALPGSPAELFRLPDLDARVLGLSDFRGRVVLLCVTSPGEGSNLVLPRFHQTAEQFADDWRVAPVAIFRTESFPGSPELAQLRMDLATAGLHCPTLLDVTSDVSRLYRTSRGTSLFVIDAAGLIRHRADEVDDDPQAFADAGAVVSRLLDPAVASGPDPSGARRSVAQTGRLVATADLPSRATGLAR